MAWKTPSSKNLGRIREESQYTGELYLGAKLVLVVTVAVFLLEAPLSPSLYYCRNSQRKPYSSLGSLPVLADVFPHLPCDFASCDRQSPSRCYRTGCSPKSFLSPSSL